MASDRVADGQLAEFHREMGQQRGVWKSIRFLALNSKKMILVCFCMGPMDLGKSNDHTTLRKI